MSSVKETARKGRILERQLDIEVKKNERLKKDYEKEKKQLQKDFDAKRKQLDKKLADVEKALETVSFSLTILLFYITGPVQAHI